MKTSFGVTRKEETSYVLSSEKDFEILDRCKNLEKLKLSDQDKILVGLIKTQLKEDWRKPLIRMLNKLSRKYQ